MVHLKRVELSHFKSFGGTTSVPLLPGFTVVSGPNGSGKSNILDALLFCLGLSSSKGMRAERLPDLVNHNQSKQRGRSEASVTVTFDLSDLEAHLGAEKDESSENEATESLPVEWSVTRRLRVTQGGNYSSSYYMNGEPCTVTELHEQLNRLRIYPEGYNVVLQGDVTSIISMNSRERREIIDELAGVAEFDRKISQAKTTLEEVKEREERCRIVEQELIHSRDRLAADRIKAEKYQKLKAQIQEYQQREAVLIWKSLQQKEVQLSTLIAAGEAEATQLAAQIELLGKEIEENMQQLTALNRQVKALGEEEQLSVSSQLASQKLQSRQLTQQVSELDNKQKSLQSAILQTQQDREGYQQQLEQILQKRSHLESQIAILTQECLKARSHLDLTKEEANAIASASEAWVQEQTTLTHQVNRLQDTLNPQRTEQAQLTERLHQLQQKITEQEDLLQSLEGEIASKSPQVIELMTQIQASEEEIQTLAQNLSASEAQQTLQQETQSRLLKEQREKQRQLDKLEATNQAQQEAQGTFATKILLQTGIPGICGLVAQLGQVDPRYSLALETAAGARLGYLVVEDDSVAAAAIELLKQKRAGRATFLPLNKISPPHFSENVALRYSRGFVDYAVNLITCEPKYEKIFAYVFGGTIVFETLEEARQHLGKYRIVTLEGEILESSGAMTGGSSNSRSSLHFGTAAAVESQEIQALQARLEEIEQILERAEVDNEGLGKKIRTQSLALTEAKQHRREQQLHLEQLQKELQRLHLQEDAVRSQITQNTQECKTAQTRLNILAFEIPAQESELQQLQEQLAELEQSQTHSEWQQIQVGIKQQETQLREKEQALRQGETQWKDLENGQLRLQEKETEAQKRLQEFHQQQVSNQATLQQLQTQQAEMQEKIAETEHLLQQLTEKLGTAKQERDALEVKLRSQQNQHQQSTWQQQKLTETQQERKIQLESLQEEIVAQESELPNPLPDLPSITDYDTQLETLQKEIRTTQKRLEALEPVNMLALEEYERTQTRLNELSEKLTTIQGERTEILLRVENFTTLRLRAFQEAFDAVNENFQSIFATLSEGDGYLDLDSSEDPFSGGLNLIAHPKGKPVQRLSSMSGGEKSLTALSFIFALQRYRPSPFYAFDEVDMFLDGANVERLARMIRQQAQQAQFIVVSLRRPMIESADRTIGVTQARGAYTQVLGIKL